MTLQLGGDGAITGCTSLENPDLIASGLTTSGSVDAEKVLVASGTAAAPSYTFSGDTDNGLYYAGTNSIGLATAGANAILIDSSNRVGIGTTSPAGKLTLKTTNSNGAPVAWDNSYFVISEGDTGTSFGLGLSLDTTNNEAQISSLTPNTQWDPINYRASQHKFFVTDASSNEAMRIDSSGNVGIGTSDPKFNLQVGNSGGLQANTTNEISLRYNMYFNGGDKYIQGANKAGSLVISDGGYYFYHTNTASTSANSAVTGLTARMRIDSSGRVGIGTTSPSNLLHLNASSDTAIRFDRGGTKQLNIGTDSGQSFIASFESKPLAFATSTSSAYAERMRIDSSGRLLVGTSTARTDYFNNTLTAMLQVEGTAASGSTSRACVSIVNNNNLTNFETPILVFGRSRGSTLNSKTLAGSGTRCGHISFQGADGSDMVEAAFIAGEVDGDSGANDMPGRLVFSTTQDGNSSPTERMRLDDEGIIYHNSSNHGIGTFVTASAGTVKYAFRGHYGSSAGSYGGNISFTVWSNGNVENTNNSYGAISDIKLKENIVDANSQWNDLKALQVRNYNFIEGQTHTQIGLVAQEVELVSPGLVSESPDVDEDGNDLGTVTKSVNYSVLYMKAVKALQEAMDRIETLEQRLSDADIA